MLKLYVLILILFSTLGLRAEDCPLVSIRSTKVLDGHRFVQYGEGWTFKIENDSSDYVVTPAHVVFDADQVQFKCGDKTYDLDRVSSSETLDIALYRVHTTGKTELGSPLFKAKKNSDRALTVTEHFDVSKLFKNGWRGGSLYRGRGTYLLLPAVKSKGVEIWTKDKDRFPQYEYSYINHVNAIRPGMSGSAFFDDPKDVPLGMNIKAVGNDHVSMVIPFPLILGYLSEMLTGSDPWKKQHPHTYYEFIHKYSAKEGLQRFRQLVWNDRARPELRIYQEPCAVGRVVESSQWVQVGGSWADSGGSWGDGGGSWADGGGSWSDGSGAANKTKQTQFTWDSMTDLNIELDDETNRLALMMIPHHYLFVENECSEEGLIRVHSPKSERLIGLELKDKDTLKIGDLELLLAIGLVADKNQKSFFNLLDERGLTNSKHPEDFKSICNAEYMGPNLKIGGAAVDKSEAVTPIPRGRWDRSLLKSILDQKTEHHDLPAYYVFMRERKFLSTKSENPLVHIECSSDGEKIKIKSANSDLTYDITLTPGSMEGSFSIQDSDVTYDFELETKNYWDYYYTDNDKTIFVSLDPQNNPLVRVKILKVPLAEKRFGAHSFNNVTPELKMVETLWYATDKRKMLDTDDFDLKGLENEPFGRSHTWGGSLIIQDWPPSPH